MGKYISFEEKKKRCEKCIYAKISKSPILGWPCYRCVRAISTLEKPTKYASSRLLLDFYEEV